MKFLLRKTVLFAVISFLAVSCKSRLAIAYVNSNKLMQQYHGSVTQHESFKAKAQRWQARIDSLTAEVQALEKGLIPARTDKKQLLLRYQEAVRQQAQQENQRLTKAVLDEINAYLKLYGKQKGYTFILGATETGNIVYAVEGTDITDDVLKGLNEQYDRQHPAATP